MANRKVGATDFSKVCQQLLNEYGSETLDVLKEVVPDTAKHAADQIRANSKQKTGAYAKGWSRKEQYARGLGVSYVVYNKTEYRVAHLLENDHKIANKYGTYGTYKGDGVIAAAEEDAEQYLISELAKRLGGQG